MQGWWNNQGSFTAQDITFYKQRVLWNINPALWISFPADGSHIYIHMNWTFSDQVLYFQNQIDLDNVLTEKKM